MPIDPSIPLSYQPSVQFNPMGTLGQLLQIRDTQQQAQWNQARIDAAQREEEDRIALGTAFAQPMRTRDSVLGSLQQSAPHLIPHAIEQFDKWDKSAADTLKARTEAASATQSYIGDLVSGLETHSYSPIAWKAALGHAAETLGPEFKKTADEYDAAVQADGGDQAAIKRFVEDLQRRSPTFHTRQTAAATVQKAESDIATADVERPGREADAAEKVRKDAATRLEAAAVISADQYVSVWNKLPAGVAMQFPQPETFDPKTTALQVRAIGMTPDQRADNVNAARTAATGERNAAIAAGQLGVARGNLQMRGQEMNRPQYARAEVVTQTGQPALANYDARTGKYYDVDTGTELSGVRAALTADMKNKAEGRQLVAKSIGAIKAYSDRIIQKIGPAQRVDAIKRGAEAVFGNDPEFRTFQDSRMALAGNLAVAQQGNKPSDFDVRAIWLPLVPDPYRDVEASARMKWELIGIMSLPDQPGVQSAPKVNPFRK